jgi:prevent-host-death family protein
METVSSAEFQRNIGHYQDRALVEDVFITRNGRERLVMMSVEKYRRLKRREREVLLVEDFTEADLEVIRKAEPPAEAAAFDHEVTG